MKIKKREVVLINAIFFCILSYIFLYIINCISLGVSSFEMDVFQTFIAKNITLLSLGFTCLLALFFGKKLSITLLTFYFLIISFECFYLFFNDYSKVVLSLNVFFVIFAYFNILFLYVEFQEAAYNPANNKSHINKVKQYFNFPVVVTSLDNQTYSGFLTSWSDNCCFVEFDDEVVHSALSGKVVINLSFENRRFAQLAQILTSDHNGIGLKFLQSREVSENVYNWIDFLTILRNRGFHYPYV